MVIVTVVILLLVMLIGCVRMVMRMRRVAVMMNVGMMNVIVMRLGMGMQAPRRQPAPG